MDTNKFSALTRLKTTIKSQMTETRTLRAQSGKLLRYARKTHNYDAACLSQALRKDASYNAGNRRYQHLAYAFLKGRTYQEAERHTQNLPRADHILKILIPFYDKAKDQEGTLKFALGEWLTKDGYRFGDITPIMQSHMNLQSLQKQIIAAEADLNKAYQNHNQQEARIGYCRKDLETAEAHGLKLHGLKLHAQKIRDSLVAELHDAEKALAEVQTQEKWGGKPIGDPVEQKEAA